MALSFSFPERLLHRLHLLPTPILDAFGNVLFGRLLAISVRRGLFEKLDGHPLSAEEICIAMGMELRGTSLLIDALAASGYLHCTKGRYTLAPEGRKWCLQGSPHYIGHLIRYFETLNPRWDLLESSLVHGGPDQPYYTRFGSAEWKEYVLAMRDLARLILPNIISHVHLRRTPKSLLDLGGSHALYSIECCRRHPSLTAIVMDFAPALECTSALVREENMEHRIRLVAGDFLSAEFPRDQDAILMFNIIHGFDAETNKRTINRALKSLNTGGKLYILDQIRIGRHGSALAQFVPLMVGLNLFNEIGGNTYTAEQVKDWCAGAKRVKVKQLRYPGLALFEVS